MPNPNLGPSSDEMCGTKIRLKEREREEEKTEWERARDAWWNDGTGFEMPTIVGSVCDGMEAIIVQLGRRLDLAA